MAEILKFNVGGVENSSWTDITLTTYNSLKALQDYNSSVYSIDQTLGTLAAAISYMNTNYPAKEYDGNYLVSLSSTIDFNTYYFVRNHTDMMHGLLDGVKFYKVNVNGTTRFQRQMLRGKNHTPAAIVPSAITSSSLTWTLKNEDTEIAADVYATRTTSSTNVNPGNNVANRRATNLASNGTYAWVQSGLYAGNFYHCHMQLGLEGKAILNSIETTTMTQTLNPKTEPPSLGLVETTTCSFVVIQVTNSEDAIVTMWYSTSGGDPTTNGGTWAAFQTKSLTITGYPTSPSYAYSISVAAEAVDDGLAKSDSVFTSGNVTTCFL